MLGVFRAFPVAALLLLPASLPAQSFTYSVDPVVIPYDPATGIGSATTFIRLSQDILPGIPVIEIAGLEMAYTHDASIFRTAAIDFAGVHLDLNGGSGPGLGNTLPYPDGATSGSVFSLVGGETIQFFSPSIIFEITLETTPATWIGDFVGGTANFIEGSPAGASPPVPSQVYSAGGVAQPTAWSFPVIEIVPTTLFFIRGDADGDGAVIAVGDAITILNGLFAGDTIGCEAGADVNADGGIDIADAISILNYGFADGPPPASPFPDCGLESIPTTLTCDEHGC